MRLILILVMAMAGCAVAPAAKVGSLPAHGVTNRMVEWTFTAAHEHADPFNEVDLDILVTAPGGSVQKVPGFWAGGNTWRVRYSSPLVGLHKWKLQCSDATDANLNGVTGELTIAAYQGDNPFYHHGFIHVAADKKHFEHLDGTPFLWLADTWWMGFTTRLAWPDDFAELTADRVKKGFNVVQIVAGLYPDMPAFDPRGTNEAGFPWTKDYSRINPEYFDAADRRVAYLADHGISPCIVGAWGYHLPWLGVDRMKKHWRYIIARYGAYPTFWCIAGETSMPFYLSPHGPKDVAFLKSGWNDVTAYVRATDPQHHPISLHPTQMSREQITDPDLLDFEMLQTGHGDWGSVPMTLQLVDKSRKAKPTMPTINSEVTYEGIMGTCHDDVVRFMVWACLLHGTAGHTYGANGIWQVNGRTVPYGKSPPGNDWGDTPWNVAMALPGSGEAGLAKKLLEKYEWWKLEPRNDLARYAEKRAVMQEPLWRNWIWYPEGEPSKDAPAAKRYFRKTFDLRTPFPGELWVSADDRFTAYINGKKVLGGSDWHNPQHAAVGPMLHSGRNVLAIEAENLPAPAGAADPAGLICKMVIEPANGLSTAIRSDDSWRVSQSVAGQIWLDDAFDDSQWPHAKVLGDYGMAPWGKFPQLNSHGPFTAAIGDELRIIYVPSDRAVEVLGLDGEYRAQAMDPVSGKMAMVGGASVKASWVIARPKGFDSADWVLVVRKVK
jgi:hypothetical protein